MFGKIAKSGLKRAMGLDNQKKTRGETPQVASAFTSNTTNNSPTGHMSAYPYRTATLQYPLDIQQRSDLGHYMMFYINVIKEDGKPGQRGDDTKRFHRHDVDLYDVGWSTSGGLVGMTADNQEEFITATKYGTTGTKGKSNPPSAHYPTNVLSQGKDLGIIEKRPARTGLNSNFGKNRTKRTKDCIVLYMPNQIASNYSAGYRESEVGSLLGAGLNAADKFGAQGGVQQAKNFITSIGNAASNVNSKSARDNMVDSAFDLANTFNSTAVPYLAQAFSDIALGMANQLGKTMGVGDIRGGYDKLSNRQMNQFLESMFTGIGFRKFSYMFKFTPKSVKEAQEVDAIIRMFKFHMLPELPMNDFGRYFKIPSEFDMHYMFRGEENTFLNKIANCVCLNVDINYTPNGYQTMRPMRDRPGVPMSEIDMKLDFMETELITKEKILEGF